MIWCRFFSYLIVIQTASAQALESINYSYLYDETLPYTFSFSIVGSAPTFVVFCLDSRDSSRALTNYAITWETRASHTDRSGTPLSVNPVHLTQANERFGQFTFTPDSGENYLVAKVITIDAHQLAYFPKPLKEKTMVMGYLADSGGAPLAHSFVGANIPFSIRGFYRSRVTISYYENDFPPAPPPFAESLTGVASVMKPDSSFQWDVSQSLELSNPGLYLIQSDTASTDGLSFRIEADYPRYSRLPHLAPPLAYVCTHQEYEKLDKGTDDKKQFDRTILNITGDTDRAKEFMKLYFRRVEEANVKFTSFKEGWKTDRGMLYIIFGAPEEVYRFTNREVWRYKGHFNLQFEFISSPTIFDPDNFVLIRNKKFTQNWMNRIEDWRSVHI